MTDIRFNVQNKDHVAPSEYPFDRRTNPKKVLVDLIEKSFEAQSLHRNDQAAMDPISAVKWLTNNHEVQMFYGKDIKLGFTVVAAVAVAVVAVPVAVVAGAMGAALKGKGRGGNDSDQKTFDLNGESTSGLNVDQLLAIREIKI